jgi:YggT family protein
MLIRILGFLLETLFFLLIASCLLRAWMNWTRVNMSVQPGGFVMALTDWLVKPLRRRLPQKLVKSRIDWASVLAAAVLALAYALISSLLFGMSDFDAAGLGLLFVFALKLLLRIALQTMMILVIGFAILSWVQPGSPAYGLLGRLTEPLLQPFRRIVPTIGGVDLSALALIVVLQICLMILG